MDKIDIKNLKEMAKITRNSRIAFAHMPKDYQINFIHWLVDRKYITHEFLDVLASIPFQFSKVEKQKGKLDR